MKAKNQNEPETTTSFVFPFPYSNCLSPNGPHVALLFPSSFTPLSRKHIPTPTPSYFSTSTSIPLGSLFLSLKHSSPPKPSSLLFLPHRRRSYFPFVTPLDLLFSPSSFFFPFLGRSCFFFVTPSLLSLGWSSLLSTPLLASAFSRFSIVRASLFILQQRKEVFWFGSKRPCFRSLSPS